ncbi:FAD-binding protein [Slackia exigua]|uniref:FAD-dependent oxidoreductase n=1 Tax=Slackia exigua TaxID=84109 RepID=UPI0028D74F92|nr:FAD-binding protein [Slackia exigua]
MSKNTSISRRHFLGGAAATGAAAALGTLVGCAPSRGGQTKSDAQGANNAKGGNTAGAWNEQPSSVANQVSNTEDHEVVIVGAGNAGVVCALEVAQLGGEVIVLEQNPNATMWAGDIDACDSQLMKDAGEIVDKEFIIHDLVRYASGKCDENLIRLWAYNSGAFVDWYQENLQKKGLDVMLDTVRKKFHPENCYYTNVYHTAYKPPLQETANPMGSEVAMPALLELLGETGGDVLYGTKVVELVQDSSGKVTGVIAEGENGLTQYNASRGVVLATGGFLGNKDMMDQLGVVSHKYCSTHMGDDGRNGDGIKMATWAGAEIDSSHAGSMLIFDRGCITAVSEEDAGIGVQGGGNPGGLWWPGSQPFLRVNKLGQRFCNEDGPYDFVFNMAVQQPGHVWWQVFDSSSWEDVVNFGTTICSRVVAQEGAKNCQLLGRYHPCRSAEEWDEVYIAPNVEQGNLIKCNSLEELAEAMDVPVATFLATVKRYNEITDSGVDTDHGKAPWRLSKIDEPPYYAAKMSGWALATLSGVHVNYDFNAVTPEGKPINGLYMAGLDVGGFFNGNYPEYYGGLCMGRCVALAWLLAHSLMGKEYPTPVESARAAF